MFCAVTSTVITNRLVQSWEISPPRPPGLSPQRSHSLPWLCHQDKISNFLTGELLWIQKLSEHRGGTIRKYPALLACQALVSNYKTDTNNYFTISPLEMTNCFSGHQRYFIVHLHVKPKPQLTRHWEISTMNWKKIKEYWDRNSDYHFEIKFVIFTFQPRQ